MGDHAGILGAAVVFCSRSLYELFCTAVILWLLRRVWGAVLLFKLMLATVMVGWVRALMEEEGFVPVDVEVIYGRHGDRRYLSDAS